VHYYLPGWKPIHPGILFISGGLFHGLPGYYDLPFREGQYTIYNELLGNGDHETRVAMRTNA